MRGLTLTLGPSGFDRRNNGKNPPFSFLSHFSFSLYPIPPLFLSLFALTFFSLFLFSFSFRSLSTESPSPCLFLSHFLIFLLLFFFLFLFLHFLVWITITRMVHKWETSSPLPPCHMHPPQIFLISNFFFIFPYVTHGSM